jgi:hypothetical protein
MSEQGWNLVPVEPTPQMRKASADAWLDCGDRLFLNKAAAALRAGIAAAPQPQPAQAERSCQYNGGTCTRRGCAAGCQATAMCAQASAQVLEAPPLLTEKVSGTRRVRP